MRDVEVRRTAAGKVRVALVAVASVVVGAALVVALAFGGMWWMIVKAYESREAENVDAVEDAFVENREGFEANAEYIGQLASSAPNAIKIGWTSRRICIVGGDLEEACRDLTDAELELRQQAPRASVITWQAKDDGRIFFSFPEDEGPGNDLMFDPQGRDARAFAKEHGFAWERDLGDGWSIPGSIPNEEDADEMWVVRWS